MDARKKRELTHRRKRGLGLVQDVETVAEKPVQQQREEGFAVRLLVKRDAAVASGDAEAVDLRGHVEERLGAKEIAVGRIARRSNQVKEQRLFGFVVTAHRLEAEVLRAAFLVESGGNRKR